MATHTQPALMAAVLVLVGFACVSSSFNAVYYMHAEHSFGSGCGYGGRLCSQHVRLQRVVCCELLAFVDVKEAQLSKQSQQVSSAK